MKNTLRFLIICAVALSCSLANAGLAVPYQPDANTMHLWHFDTSTTVNGFPTSPDAVTNNPITLTNYGLPSGTPPFTNTWFTNISASSALVGSLFLAPNPAAGAQAMAEGPQDMAATNFYNFNSGAFTFEALVYIGGNIYSGAAGSGEWEILCGDNSVGTRGWQFRLQNGTTPSINLVLRGS